MRSDVFPQPQPGEPAAEGTHAVLHRSSAAVSEAPHIAQIRLGPGDGFPTELTTLPLIEVQVLHSRLSSQLDWELCCGPQGPHPVTQDRHQELVAELGTRRIAQPQPGTTG